MIQILAALSVVAAIYVLAAYNPLLPIERQIEAELESDWQRRHKPSRN